MKKSFLALGPVVMVATLVACSTGAVAMEPVGSVIDVEGRVTALDAAGKERVLATNSVVFLNDKVTTTAGTKLLIRLKDDTEVAQGESAEMTIDQYVYDPARKENNNCLIRLVRGVFRTVTGKIVEANPEKFKVRMRMATVGIRGCDIGFRLDAGGEQVYVLDLPEGHSIEIVKDAPPGSASVSDSDSLLPAGVAGEVKEERTDAKAKEVVEKKAAAKGSRAEAIPALSFTKPGMKISIGGEADMQEQPMSDEERRMFFQQSTPSRMLKSRET